MRQGNQEKEQETSLATVDVQSTDGIGERGSEAGQRRERAGHKPSPTTPVDLEMCIVPSGTAIA